MKFPAVLSSGSSSRLKYPVTISESETGTNLWKEEESSAFGPLILAVKLDLLLSFRWLETFNLFNLVKHLAIFPGNPGWQHSASLHKLTLACKVLSCLWVDSHETIEPYDPTSLFPCIHITQTVTTAKTALRLWIQMKTKGNRKHIFQTTEHVSQQHTFPLGCGISSPVGPTVENLYMERIVCFQILLPCSHWFWYMDYTWIKIKI